MAQMAAFDRLCSFDPRLKQLLWEIGVDAESQLNTMSFHYDGFENTWKSMAEMLVEGMEHDLRGVLRPVRRRLDRRGGGVV